MSNKNIPFIDMSLCTKCYKCIEKCSQQAIYIRKKEEDDYTCKKCIKYCVLMSEVTCKPENICIVYERCNSCGECISVCENNAIRWAKNNFSNSSENEQ